MDLIEYQKKALNTATYPHIGRNIVYPALGLAGESGETIDKIKKVFRRNSEFTSADKEDIARELGDVLWYVAVLAYELGYDLDVIADMNLIKLADRQRRNAIIGGGDNR